MVKSATSFFGFLIGDLLAQVLTARQPGIYFHVMLCCLDSVTYELSDAGAFRSRV
jgi:hypothetical protein